MSPEDHVLEALSDARRSVGAGVPVFVQKGILFEHHWETVTGHCFGLGVISPYYLAAGSVELLDARVLVFQDELLDDYASLAQAMQGHAERNEALLVVAPRIAGVVAHLMVVNHTREVMLAVGVQGPDRPAPREDLQAVCAATGAGVVARGQALADARLGSARRVLANRDHLLIQPQGGIAAGDQALVFRVGGNTPAQIDDLLGIVLAEMA